MTIEIKSRDGEVIYSTEADSVADALMRAVKEGAYLSRADLSDAYLSRAKLVGAYLSDANLSGANLSGADLVGAYLSDANLSGANLSGADLAGADLSDADLSDANLSGAKLVGAKNLPGAPIVEDLDAKILAAINDGGSLNMSSWHGTHEQPCGTTHCRAGWAIVLAGDEGKALEAKFGPAVAGTLIYLASTGRVPNFYANDKDALEDIKRCAAGAS